MPYRVTNITRERITIGTIRLAPGVETTVDDMTDDLVSAWSKNLVSIDPAPGSSGSGVIPVQVVNTSANPVPVAAPIGGLAVRLSGSNGNQDPYDVEDTPVQVLSANLNRKSLFIENTDPKRIVWLAYSAAECVAEQCIKIPANFYYEQNMHVPVNEIWLRSTGPGTSARVIVSEGT